MFLRQLPRIIKCLAFQLSIYALLHQILPLCFLAFKAKLHLLASYFLSALYCFEMVVACVGNMPREKENFLDALNLIIH